MVNFLSLSKPSPDFSLSICVPLAETCTKKKRRRRRRSKGSFWEVTGRQAENVPWPWCASAEGAQPPATPGDVRDGGVEPGEGLELRAHLSCAHSYVRVTAAPLRGFCAVMFCFCKASALPSIPHASCQGRGGGCGVGIT